MLFKILKFLGGFILTITVILAMKDISFAKNAIATEGVVIDDHQPYGEVTIQFTTLAHKPITFRYSPQKEYKTYVLGHHVRVLYLADAPEEAKNANYRAAYWFVVFWFSFLGVWCLLVGFNGIGKYKPTQTKPAISRT